jgi:hypothetical protein
MTDQASISWSLAARITAGANNHSVVVKARSAGCSQNPRIIIATLQGYLP